MKKTRFLVLVLAVAIMLVGAGYAWWTDTLTINNTVTTGNLAVEFMQQPNFSEFFTESNYVVLDPVVKDAKNVSFTVKNMYPGACYVANCQEKNVGTIGAKFDNAVVTVTGPQAIRDNFTANLSCWVYNTDGTLKEELPVQNVSIDNLATAFNTALDGLVLEPGQYLTFNGESVDHYTTYCLSGNAGNDTENGTISFSVTLNWKQFNQ